MKGGIRDALARKLAVIKRHREEVRIRNVTRTRMQDDLLGSEGWRALRKYIENAVDNLSNRLTSADPNNPALIAGLQGQIKALKGLVAFVEEPVRSGKEK